MVREGGRQLQMEEQENEGRGCEGKGRSVSNGERVKEGGGVGGKG